MTERIQFIVEMDIHRGHGWYQTDQGQPVRVTSSSSTARTPTVR
jgi:hypothetical protein